MDDVSPRMHARPISRSFIEADPLRQYHPDEWSIHAASAKASGSKRLRHAHP
jgi:hypothetical protein